MQRAFKEGLSEYNVENFDETNTIFDMMYGRMLALRGENKFTYEELSGETNGFTIRVRISGRDQSMNESAFVIFKNGRSSYPIAEIFASCRFDKIRVCTTVRWPRRNIIGNCKRV